MSDLNQAHFTLYSDGGSRGNPGPAAYAFVIYNPDGKLIAEGTNFIGDTTNNQAEYQGIVAALEVARTLHLTAPLVCKLDSQLVVRQISGQYKMKNADLKPWLDKVHDHLRHFSVPVTFVDVPRSENSEADRLLNVTLDGATHGQRHA